MNAEKIKEMTDAQLKNYIEFLGSSVSIFAMQKEKLKSAFDAEDYSSVIQWMKIIRNTLTRINADNLAADCEKQIDLNHNTSNIRHEKLEIFVAYLLASLSLLSDDIKTLDISKQE